MFGLLWERSRWVWVPASHIAPFPTVVNMEFREFRGLSCAFKEQSVELLIGVRGLDSFSPSLPIHTKSRRVLPAVWPSLRRRAMRPYGFFSLIPLLFLGVQQSASAQDVQVPAGTLLRCTLNEPDFSSKSAQVGDPVLCHISVVQEFGRAAFPRGAYMAGHLEAEKEPGHFWGKGNLKLVFDRIGLPNTDVPINAKVIAARGFHVDREGDILGKGHPKRDVIEWMFPPLWPWKVLTLPARGPRPTLKGEETLTLRLMEDVTVPRLTASSGADWRLPRPQASASTSTEPYAASSYAGRSVPRSLRYAPPSYPAMTNAFANVGHALSSRRRPFLHRQKRSFY
jgi:hypothetical protein